MGSWYIDRSRNISSIFTSEWYSKLEEYANDNSTIGMFEGKSQELCNYLQLPTKNPYAILTYLRDLGIIDDGVRVLLSKTGYPGMKVFEFAFDGDPNNDYLPSNIKTENCVVYTGTHDNDTLRSFVENKEKEERRSFETVLEEECLKADVAYVTESLEDECQSIIELLFSLKANTVIIPMHDVLCFGEEARLNAPSTVSGKNWTFRFTEKDFKRRKAAWLKQLAETYKRN